jgi:hypothetical protein
MQRSTVHSTRRAQEMLPSDDDGSKIVKSPTLSSYAQVLFRKANLAALLFVSGVFFIYLNSVGAPVVSAGVLAAVATPVATTTNKVAVVSALKPISCQKFIDEAKRGTYRGRQVIDPNLKKGRFTRQTTTEHPFWISIHNKQFDNVRWGIYENGWYYERALEKIWTDILREASPGSRVLDVGYVALRYVSTTTVLCFIMCCFCVFNSDHFFVLHLLLQWQHWILRTVIRFNGRIQD